MSPAGASRREPAPARTAFLFPGQGAETSGALRIRPGPVTRLLARASRALGVDIARVVARGDPLLGRTEIAQPALIAVCLGIAEELAGRGVLPDAVAGHSLGELAAVAAAGCLSAEQAVDLAVERGRLFAEAARDAPGALVAVRVDDAPTLARLLDLGRAQGRITVAAHNAPTQWVLSGDRSALTAVAVATPATFLPTGGAWHSQAMAPVEDRWLHLLRAANLRPTRCTLIVNRRGAAVEPGDDLAVLLAGQLTRPIAWVETLETLTTLGVNRWITVGPGKALRGLCRETLGPDCSVEMASGESVR